MKTRTESSIQASTQPSTPTRIIHPATFSGTLNVPTSKSLTHRALIIAAFSALQHGKPAIVRSPLRSDDTTLTLAALKTMGFESTVSENDEEIFAVEFSGKRITPHSPITIDIHHSGTSARLLTAVAAIQPLNTSNCAWIEVDGSARMRQRPMQELIVPLEELGAKLEAASGFLPIRIHSPITKGGTVRVNASKSSQFLSALLLIAPLLEGTTDIVLDGEIASKSYSDMTIAQMRSAGIIVAETSHGYSIRGNQTYSMPDYAVEGDYSAASYPLAAAVITGGAVTIQNIAQESPQGDHAIVEILRDFGADIVWTNNGLRMTGHNVLRGVERDMNSCPDIVPTVAVTALFAETKSVFRNIEHLRYKESDRIAAVIENIRRLGGKAYTEASNDGGGDALVVEPSKYALHGASVPTYDDHRMAMSFALVGLRVPGVVIEHPECVAKSYPLFWRDFEAYSSK
jgi:3-phosphoshikimate 1-carboxyvinyltransferase